MYMLSTTSKSHIDPIPEYLGMGTLVYANFFAYIRELDDYSESEFQHEVF
ncbi:MULTISPECIES: hypothetical protein [Bacillaceae]|uniref:Uncharacterized protein n=1 Tax=Peribacillus huizhouensis TaxID=1501239 RepID=A0ABR6CU55_9BACI|nr:MULTISPECIES: hypothetical protein [Bacillaceae]MBA9028564.1 hypothetical protein [Peribacillus huizhouensis]